MVLESLRPGCSSGWGLATSACASRTRGSCTARSPASVRTAPGAGPPGTTRMLPPPRRPARPGRIGRAPPGGAQHAAADRRTLGGALMAVFGIMAALREARRRWQRRPSGSGEGQIVDVSMCDGALSWLAMVAGAYSRRGGGAPPAAAICRWRDRADLLPPVRVRRRLGVAGRARAEVLAGVVSRRRARGADRAPVRATRAPPRTAQVQEIFKAAHARRMGGPSRASTTAASRAGARPRRRCSPRSSWRTRGMVESSEQPGAERSVRQLGIPVQLARTPGEHARLPGPALGEHTEEAPARRGLLRGRRWPSCWPRGRRPVPPALPRARASGRERWARCVRV